MIILSHFKAYISLGQF